MIRLVALLFLAPGLALAQGAFGELKEQAQQRQAGGKGERHAFVIGIDQYDDPAFPALRFASSDAADLGAVLADPRHGGFASVQVVTDGDLSTLGLVHRLESWAKALSPDDLALVYFSGHGLRWLDERKRPHVYLATPETVRADPVGSSLPMQAVREFVETLPTLRRVLVVDACFTGDGKVSSTDAQAASRALIDEEMPYPVRARDGEAQLFSTTYGKPAMESADLGHGVYTHHLIAALSERFDDADLNNDLVVSVSEAHDFAREETQRFTQDLQVPMIHYRFIGQETLLLAGDPDSRRRTRMAMVTSYAGPEQGMRLFVDGEERGAFPRTVLVDPGPRAVEFRNEAGKVIDRGRVTFKPEGVYEVSKIRDGLNGGRHVIMAGYAHTWLPGEAFRTEAPPSAPGFRVGYNFRFPSKDPFLRKLGLEADVAVGFFPELPVTLDGVERTAPATTSVELGFGPTIRLDLGPVSLQAQPRVAVMNLWREEVEQPFGHWILGLAGGDFGVSVRPVSWLGFGVRYAPMLTSADLKQRGEPGLELMHRLVGQVEFGI